MPRTSRHLSPHPWKTYILLPGLLLLFGLQVGFILGRADHSLIESEPTSILPTPSPVVDNKGTLSALVYYGDKKCQKEKTIPPCLGYLSSYYFKVFNSSDDQLAATGTTDSIGRIRLDLAPGNYYWRENNTVKPIEFAIYPNVLTQILITVSAPIQKTTTEFSCPLTETWVDCLPGPGNTKSECRPDYIAWATNNCETFKGVAY